MGGRVGCNGCGGPLALGTGVMTAAYQQKKINFNHGEKTVSFAKKTIAGIALSGALAVPGIALAATSTADANTTGGYCVKSARGCQAALEAGAQAGSGAGSGAFGAFGNFGDVAHDFSGGADGFQTGLNNSSVAGNRQSTQSDPTP